MSHPPATPAETVDRFLSLMAVFKYDEAMALLSDSVEYINPPPIGAVTGPAAARAVLEPFFAPTLENELRVLRRAQNGAVVITERLDRHRMESGWIELPVTGVFEVHDGRITYWRDYFDAATILSQMPAA